MYQQLHKRTKQCLPKYKRRGWGVMRGEGGKKMLGFCGNIDFNAETLYVGDSPRLARGSCCP